MTTEDKLKEYILDRYKSIREFTQVVDMSYSTVDSILKRGIGNSSVSNIIKICKVLEISVDELAEGRITPISKTVRNYIAHGVNIEISDILRDTKSRLESYQKFTLDGQPVNRETISTIVKAIEVGEEIAKKK